MSRRSIGKLFPWFAGLVLVAGVVAFGTVYVFDTGDSVESKLVDRETGPAVVNAPRKNVALDPEARRVAGEFILTAVARDNLAKSYTITHPDLRQGLSKQQWESGNIPVQFYPAEAIDTATFKIDESYPDEAVLQVALVPKDGSEVKPQIFYIGLKKVKGEWLVYYWAPRSGIAIPSVGG
jgi:hypothetical protein